MWNVNQDHIMLLGKVVDGKKLGRTIGFPTANLQVKGSKVIPKKEFITLMLK